MPLTDDIQPFHIRLVPGQDTKHRDTLLETDHVEVSQNGRYDNEVGSVVKRPSPAKYNGTTLGDSPVYSVFRFYTKTSKFLLAAHGSSMYVGNDLAGTFSAIKTGMTSSRRFSFEVYRDLCLFSNGFDPIYVTDGVAAWELGACRAETIAGGTNLDASATYSYKITMDDDEYYCGTVSNTVTTGSAGGKRKVSLTNIPLGPLGTTNRKIYRTIGNGSDHYLIATIADNSTTTYTDDIPDTTATPLPLVVTDPMPKGRYIKVYRERLFVARSEDHPSRIYYSNAFLPGYIQGTSNLDYADISPDDGDVITGIPIMLGTMCVFKRNSIRKFNIDHADPDSWVVDDPISYEGCPAPYSIAQTPYGIIYKGWRHMQMFDGAFSKPIIDEFDSMDDIQYTSQSQCVGFWHGQDYLLSYISKDSGVDAFDKVMRYDYLRNAVNIDTIPVASFTALVGDEEAGELYYGASDDGFVYLAENYERNVSLNTKTQLNGGSSYHDTFFVGLDDIYLGGTDANPTIEIGWTLIIDDAVGTINGHTYGTPAGSAIIDREDSDGTYTSEAFFIDAGSMLKIYWNEELGDYGTVYVQTRSGAVAVPDGTWTAWSANLTTPGGSTIVTAADDYFQFRIVMSTSNISYTPKIVLADGYVVKFTYFKGAFLPQNVPFYYGTGYRNFGQPHADKIYKKLIVVHSGVGTYVLTWTTDLGYTGSWTVDMDTANPMVFESFYPSNAYGRKIKIDITKDDTSALTVKEIMGLWSPRPILI